MPPTSKKILTDTEYQILRHLIVSGHTSAGAIAKNLRLKRPTAYAALENLIRLGIVTRHAVQGAARFAATTPRDIARRTLENATRDFEQAKRDSRRLFEELSALHAQAPTELAGYEVRALEAADPVHLTLAEILSEGHYSGIFNPQIVCIGKVKKIVAKFLAEGVNSRVPIRELAVPGKVTEWYIQQIRNPNHQMRTLPANMSIESDIILSKGRVIFGHYKEGRELALQIRQPDLFASLTGIFEHLWSYAPEAK
jgi:predicted transcriptional regulator